MSHGRVLLDILIVLIAAKAAAEAAERLGTPAVVGEILAGMLIGPSVLGLVEGGEVLQVLGEIGVILLLLAVGLEMSLGDLRAVGRPALLVALVGVASPFALGWGASSAFGHGGNTAVFVGAALTATSVGITARVFSDLRALATVEARTVLGAAVADDVLGLVILTVVVRLTAGDSVTPATVAGIIGVAVLFLVVTTAAGVRLAPALFGAIHRRSRSTGTLVALALAFTLAVASLAEAARLAPIVGAFVAGLALAGTGQAERIHRELTPVGHLFIPVFFLQIGIEADVGEFARPDVLALAGALLAAAVVGKLVSAVGARGAAGDKLLIGAGMLPRGEVGLIFAAIGQREGVLGDDLYAAVLLVVLLTTLAAPPVLRWRIGRLRSTARPPAASTAVPPGGWLRVEDRVVDLVADAQPPDHLALDLALQAALLVTDGRPGPRLLDWLGAGADRPLRWDATSTGRFLQVLREGNDRSWRLLEASGVLERALPELADTLRRRWADPFQLDPAHLLRWSLVDRVKEAAEGDARAGLEFGLLARQDILLLAALVLETAGEDDAADAVVTARALAKRLDLGAAAEQELALLVGDSALLRAAAGRPDALAEDRVLQLAGHLDTPERARALYVLSVALGELDRAERERLDELHELIQEALAHPELTGRETRNLAQRRRAEAARLVADPAVAERARTAPQAYVLGRDPADVARQAALVEPRPAAHEVRLAVTPVPSTNGAGPHWRLEVATRDRTGLLAIVTGALHDAGLDVLDATVVTWADGAALESFRVRPRAGGPEPDADALRSQVAAAFGRPVVPASAVADAVIHFEDEGSPWYTRCEIAAADRPGLLHALAAGLAAAGADVHAATVATHAGAARDSFELTDGSGRKLDEAAREAVRRAVIEGAGAGRERRRARLSRRS